MTYTSQFSPRLRTLSNYRIANPGSCAVLERANWPQVEPKKEEPKIQGRAREVSRTGRGHAGEFDSEKLGRKVQYESQNEFEFLQTLERDHNVAWYQEQPLSLPYQFKGKEYLYYPDVVVRLRDGRTILVEVRTIYDLATEINLAKAKALEQFCGERGWGILVTNGSQTLDEIHNRSSLPSYESAVLLHLQNGKLDYPSYKSIQSAHQATYLDLCALVLRQNLKLTCRPWRLSLG